MYVDFGVEHPFFATAEPVVAIAAAPKFDNRVARDPERWSTVRLSTGIEGLDEIIEGGLPAGRNCLIRGGPGTGKTTLALHFLTEAVDADRPPLYVSLVSPAEDVQADAASAGFDLKGVEFLDLSTPDHLVLDDDNGQLSRADEGRDPIVQAITARVRELAPERIAIDSLTRLQGLLPETDDLRRQVMALLRILAESGATVVGLSEETGRSPDDELQFLADGIITLRAGVDARAVQVTKLRGSSFQRGWHTVRLHERGMTVFPRLAFQAHADLPALTGHQLSTGVPELNELLHGGLERGTVTIISGPSGTGKTTIGAQFMKEAAGRGERSALLMLDESPSTFLHRAAAVSIPVNDMIDRGTLSLIPMDPLSVTPDEIAARVRTEVEEHGTTAVMIDSIASYQLTIHEHAASGLSDLHALGRYLRAKGVIGLLTDEVATVTGDFTASGHKLSHLADTVMFLRYMETDGQLRKVIGVLKKRTSSFENVLRELQITEYGIKVGEPLNHLRGVLSGIPENRTD